MRHGVRLGLAAALVVAVSGCGTAVKTAPAVKTGAVGTRMKTQAVIGMKEAFQVAAAHTKATYGDDFRPVMAFADHFLDAKGQPQPATWRFNMVGHLRGQAAYSLVKVQVQPDGTPFVDPKRGGPFPDHNKLHQHPQLDLTSVLAPEAAAWEVVLTEGYARKYPPMTAVSWKIGLNERLKHTVMTFNWSAKRPTEPGTTWLVDTSIDPVTGEVIENGAYKL